jgi:hypothetical protein
MLNPDCADKKLAPRKISEEIPVNNFLQVKDFYKGI